MNKINNLDKKYIVLKLDDLDKYIGKGLDRSIFEAICNKIAHLREKEGKQQNEYVVLNLDDTIDITYLIDFIRSNVYDRPGGRYARFCVKDIAVGIVNAILKTKETKND